MAKTQTSKARKPFKKKSSEVDTSTGDVGTIRVVEHSQGLDLELVQATFIQGVNLRTTDGVGRTQTSHVQVGTEEHGNKHGITRLWTDGFFVYVFSDKYQDLAVPCSNLLQAGPKPPFIGQDVAPQESPEYPFRQTEPGSPEEEYARDLAAFDPANQSGVITNEVTPEEDVGPLYVINDPGHQIPNEEATDWLQEKGLEGREPGEYVVMNYDPLTYIARLQNTGGTFHPIKIPETLL